MKKLVLGVLLASAASATGCVSDGATVTMSWSFEHLETGTRDQCPPGYDTAIVIAQPADPASHLGAGKTFIDKFDCSDGIGRLRLTDNAYLVWIEIVDGNDETRKFAKSQEIYYDTLEGNANFSVAFLADGGYFSFTWDLVDANQRVLSCRDAGITGGDTSVATVATSIANKDYFKADVFDCEDHFGVSDGLLDGFYTFSIDADDGVTNHKAPDLKDVEIRPNFVTFLGDIKIPIR